MVRPFFKKDLSREEGCDIMKEKTLERTMEENKKFIEIVHEVVD